MTRDEAARGQRNLDKIGTGERPEPPPVDPALRARLDTIQVLNADNRLLRELLWLRHGCVGLYGDDGEMQCGTCLLDFKRASPESIQARFQAMGLEKLAAAQATLVDPRGVGAQPGDGPSPAPSSAPREACERYSLARPEFEGVTFCHKSGARAAQAVLDERDALRAEMDEAVEDEHMRAHESLCRLRARAHTEMVALTEALDEVKDLKSCLSLVKTKAQDVWLWQGGGDQPESLSCPVVMSADTLRALVPSPEALQTIRKGLHHTQKCLVGMGDGELCSCGLAKALSALEAL